MNSLRLQHIARGAAYLGTVALLAGGLMFAQQPGYPPPGGAPQAPAPAQMLGPQQLDTLVAPVALYPDRLLGQILAASTYPLEIAEAAQWLQGNPTLQGAQLVEAARQQNWDPSIQALVVFPDVLSRLASDIRWTTDLGNAFLAQQADVMTAVQRMRAQAKASGKLRSNSQQTVTNEMDGDQSAIDIQPANPEMVYVPYYNPTYIWGPPAYGYYPPWDYLDVGYGLGYGFGPGIYIGGFFGGLGWGGWGWGCNWSHHSLYLNGAFFGRYGYGGHGFERGGIWAHNPGHRMGIAYPNRALSGRYGAASMSGARSSFSASRYSSAPRAGAAAGGGWNHFGGGQSGYRSTPGSSGGNAYRGSTPGSSGGNAYRGSTPGSGGGNTYRGSTPGSSGGNTYRGSTPGYRSSPSYSNANRGSSSSGGSNAGRTYGYGGNRGTPSYGSTRAYSGGSSRSYSGGATRSSSGGATRSYSGGSPRSSGGGGGSSHGGSGGGSHGGGGHR